MIKKLLVVLIMLTSFVLVGCDSQGISYTAKYGDTVDITFVLSLDESVMTNHNVPKQDIDEVISNISSEFGYTHIDNGYEYTFTKSFVNTAYNKTLTNRQVKEVFGLFFYQLQVTYLIPISSGIVKKTIDDMCTALAEYGIERADITGDIEYKYDTPFRSVSTEGTLTINNGRYEHSFKGSYEELDNSTIEIIRYYPNTTTWYIVIALLSIIIITISVIISKNRYKNNQGEKYGSQDNAK